MSMPEYTGDPLEALLYHLLDVGLVDYISLEAAVEDIRDEIGEESPTFISRAYSTPDPSTRSGVEYLTRRLREAFAEKTP